MDHETTEALALLTKRIEETELRCKILAYALTGAVSQLNPNAETVARRLANTAVLAYCPEGERARRLEILEELFPDARNRSGDKDYIPPFSG